MRDHGLTSYGCGCADAVWKGCSFSGVLISYQCTKARKCLSLAALRMLHDAGSDHIQIHIPQAIQQVPAILNHCAVIRMLPNRSLMPLAPVEAAGHGPGRQLHHPSYCSPIMRVRYNMGVITRDTICIHCDTIPVDRGSQPFSICLPFFRELEQKPTIMTAVGQMICVSFHQVSRSSGHVKILADRGIA